MKINITVEDDALKPENGKDMTNLIVKVCVQFRCY